MSNAITMGIFWHLIGAASAACFYAPFKKVKKWSWETMWSVGGIDHALSRHVDGNWHRHWHYVDCRYADDANYQRQFRCVD